MKDADPVSKVLLVMGTKQRWHIIRCLLIGHTKFNQIKRDCGISSTALSRTLKYLEGEGLVAKRSEYGKMPITEYSLTKKGRGFSKIVEAMARAGSEI